MHKTPENDKISKDFVRLPGMRVLGTQTIETERLILRRFEYTDIDSMLKNWISDEKTQWDYGEPYYPTPEAVQNLFDTKYIVSYSKDDYYRWAVIEKESN
ncbi:MAG: GNAT family N-acetyltransferase, partial [Treponema sp.]|nr:GNAT family N-acetyltransferase [Treponema sp.]